MLSQLAVQEQLSMVAHGLYNLAYDLFQTSCVATATITRRPIFI